MTGRLAPALAVTSAALLALTLAACAPEASPSPSGSASGTTKPSATGSASASGSATPSEAPTSAPPAAADCLPGTWVMDQASLDRFYGDVNAALSGAGVSFTPKGSAELTLGADGAFSWAPALELTAEVAGTPIVVTVGGSTSGTYTATADRLTSDTVSADGLEVSATIDGAPTDAGELSDQVASAPVADSAYTCEGDTLTLVSEIGGSPANSVFTRR